MRHRTTRHALPGGPLRIRPGLAADAAAVESLVESVILEDRWFLASPDEWQPSADRRARDLEALLHAPGSLALVAVRNGAVLGLAQARAGALRRTAHESHLEVYVRADARGGGVGRTLLLELVRRARERPAMHRVALAVFADNLRARSLYEAIGFVVEGCRRGAGRERDGSLRDEILMAMDVGDRR